MYARFTQPVALTFTCNTLCLPSANQILTRYRSPFITVVEVAYGHHLLGQRSGFSYQQREASGPQVHINKLTFLRFAFKISKSKTGEPSRFRPRFRVPQGCLRVTEYLQPVQLPRPSQITRKQQGCRRSETQIQRTRRDRREVEVVAR